MLSHTLHGGIRARITSLLLVWSRGSRGEYLAWSFPECTHAFAHVQLSRQLRTAGLCLAPLASLFLFTDIIILNSFSNAIAGSIVGGSCFPTYLRLELVQ